MQMPSVVTSLRDPETNITIQVVAYRKLTQNEFVNTVRYFRSTKAGRKLKANRVYRIMSIIGHNDPL